MKFRWKLMVMTLFILSFTFGFGGMLLIQYSFVSTLKQEKKSAANSYEMVLRMLKGIDEMESSYQNQTVAGILKRLDSQGALTGCSVRLLRMEGDKIQWKQPLYLNHTIEDFRNVSDIPNKKATAMIFRKNEKNYYQITSVITYGKETLVFQNSYDISNVYTMRAQQLSSFRRIFILVLAIGTVLSYFVAYVLVKPLQRVSVVSGKIADGDYSVRVPVDNGDEIGEMSENFNYMTEQLVEKLLKMDVMLKNQEEFMGSFAHELKTPMTSIIGYADLMRREQLTKEEQKEASQYIYSEGKRLQNLSQKLMMLLVLKNQKFQMQERDIVPIIKETVSSMKKRIQDQNIFVNLELKSAVCRMEPDLMKSLLLNLIDNGLKAMDAGGVLTIENEKTENGLKILLEDTGCGMPRSEIEKITEAFYRIDKSRSRKQGGAGLGLALCKEIVRIHQGSMEIVSQERKGTIIIISIKEGKSEETI